MRGHYEADLWVPESGSVMDLAGMFHHVGPPFSIEEMDAALIDAVAEHVALSLTPLATIPPPP